jgi:hypothetical protein
MGLEPHFTVHWIGHQGLQFKDLDSLIDRKRDILPTPNILLIHCGSNDLTEKELTGKGLIENIKCSVLRYKALLRNIVIVWSSMLQRRYWHFAPLNTGPIIDQKRRRVNSAVRTFVIENGGGLFGMRVT